MGNLLAWVGAAPGIAALLGSAVGFGVLLNRVKNVEANQAKMELEIAQFRQMAVTVGRIDERTKATQDLVNRIDGKLIDTIGAALSERGERRTFREDMARG